MVYAVECLRRTRLRRVTLCTLRVYRQLTSTLPRRTRVCSPVRSGTAVSPLPVVQRSIVMSVSVCVFVCASVHEHISRTTRPIFNKLFEHFTYGRGSVLLWRRGDTLCTSGFVDDIMGRIEKCRYRCSE